MYYFVHNFLSSTIPLSFTNFISQSQNTELIKLYPNSDLVWTRELSATFIQPQMSFANFPIDKQNFPIFIQSYSCNNKFITLGINTDNTENFYSKQISKYIQNQLWNFDSSSFYKTTTVDIHDLNNVFEIISINLMVSRSGKNCQMDIISKTMF